MGSIEGFVVEGHSAGGHNAPPRGGVKLDEQGEPIYGVRDTVDLEKIRALGLPFGLAGSQAGPEQLEYALSIGASGVQVGTAFAFSKESGLEPELKRTILGEIRDGDVRVFTDPLASPTGFPFKIVQLSGTLSEETEYTDRDRLCQIGYLRSIYKREDGALGYRCPGEPVEDYTKKGGSSEDTHGKKCLCNALAANIGLPHTHKDGYVEKPLITSGDTLLEIRKYFSAGSNEYSASDVIDHILGNSIEPAGARVNTNDEPVYEAA
jgi:nitronate monooxygenase